MHSNTCIGKSSSDQYERVGARIVFGTCIIIFEFVYFIIVKFVLKLHGFIEADFYIFNKLTQFIHVFDSKW